MASWRVMISAMLWEGAWGRGTVSIHVCVITPALLCMFSHLYLTFLGDTPVYCMP